MTSHRPLAIPPTVFQSLAALLQCLRAQHDQTAQPFSNMPPTVLPSFLPVLLRLKHLLSPTSLPLSCGLVHGFIDGGLDRLKESGARFGEDLTLRLMERSKQTPAEQEYLDGYFRGRIEANTPQAGPAMGEGTVR